ncbi:Protein of unknown function [Streptococcus thermophilus]|nr:Protein of unknown function [Streptococcus thermophilus]
MLMFDVSRYKNSDK